MNANMKFNEKRSFQEVEEQTNSRSQKREKK